MPNKIQNWTKKNSPELLMTTGLIGLTFCIGWSVKATINAVRLCDAKKRKENKDSLTVKEVIKTTWKCYVPVGIGAALSIPCIIAGNRISSKRQVALSAAYAVSTTALNEYRKKTEEIVGEETAKKIKEAISEDKAKESKSTPNTVVLGEGEQIWHEPYSDRYFKSTWNKIQEACNTINERALNDIGGTYTLNDWYEALGLDPTKSGELLGWATPGCLTLSNKSGLLRISAGATISKDGVPCGCIYYDVEPYAL